MFYEVCDSFLFIDTFCTFFYKKLHYLEKWYRWYLVYNMCVCVCVFQTIIDIIKEISNTNVAAVLTSVITISTMTFNNEFLKPWIGKSCSVPVPIELIAVVTGTLVSNYCNLSDAYNIETVGHIPTGLPKPELPVFHLLPTVALDSIAITMVSYTITMSMALIFAQKLNYDINSNQELFAMVRQLLLLILVE